MWEMKTRDGIDISTTATSSSSRLKCLIYCVIRSKLRICILRLAQRAHGLPKVPLIYILQQQQQQQQI